MELPAGLVYAAAAYIAVTGAAIALLALVAAPAAIITRPRRRWFADWHDALAAPWLFWRIGGALFRLQELLGNYVLPAPQRVCDMAFGHFRSQVVITVTELGVPDLLAASGPMTAHQLADATHTHRPYLERVLRAAARMGLLTMRHAAGGGGGRWRLRAGACKGGGGDASREAVLGGPLDMEGAVFDLTQLSAVLTERHPNSVKAMVQLFGDHYGPAGELLEGLRRGAVPYTLWAGGKDHWQHMTDVPQLCTRFNRAMAQFNNLSPVEAVFMAYPSLGAAARVVDVGGGLGAFAAAALARWPWLRGALFDLPRVVDQARDVWAADAARRAAVDSGRITFHSGSFFEAGALPRAACSGGEVYVLREILHDWADADCTRILREVRAAIGNAPGCRLVIVEAVLSGQLLSTASARVNGDVHMLVQYGGACERTPRQLARLLDGAGFTLARVLPTKGLFFVVEALPA